MEALLGAPFFEGGPIFPPVPPSQAVLHRGWITAAADPRVESSAKWALAKFALDDLAHRAAILARLAQKDRKENPGAATLAPEIMEEFSQMLDDLQDWRMKPIIQEGEANERLVQMGRLPPATVALPFLDTPPLQ